MTLQLLEARGARSNKVKEVYDGNFHLTLKDSGITEVEPCKHLFLIWVAGEGLKRGSMECLCKAKREREV